MLAILAVLPALFAASPPRGGPLPPAFYVLLWLVFIETVVLIGWQTQGAIEVAARVRDRIPMRDMWPGAAVLATTVACLMYTVFSAGK